MSETMEALAEHHTLSDVVFHRLRDAIIDGRLAPGQWLRQEALAQEFGLSQMPVREALRRLVAEGLAERLPYRGVRVVEFTPEDIADMFTLRLVLESLAVRHATPIIAPQEIEALRKNLDQGAGLTSQEEMPLRRELNTTFHLAICRASGHRYLVRQVESLWAWFPSVMLYEGMRRQKELSLARLAREHEEHRAILSALEERDPDRAESETRRHIRNLAQELAEVLGIDESITWEV